MATHKPIDLTQLPEGHRVEKILRTYVGARGSGRHLVVVYRCACGAEATTIANSLRTGKVKSCGCLRAINAVGNTTHGRYVGADKKHPLCATWTQMIARCYSTTAKEYPRYGGRGILVCARWRGKSGFKNFVSDMGSRPEGCTMDRIDNDKGYSRKNCRWATRRQQQRNLRSNRRITCNGKRRTIAEWAEVTGLSPSTITSRLAAGRSVAQALGAA